MTSQPTIGLALGGGAARGLAHIVVLEAPRYVHGAAVGRSLIISAGIRLQLEL
jgi:hypothetical protein